jgi:class 3 adenylate cyclase/tetratricopeptide (TPR) repeat protein
MPGAPAVGNAGERKFAVLVFADLTGYTDLCRRLDPEDVAATVRPVMMAMKAAVEDEGGVVPSIAGDGFMAVFGVPVAHSDAATRAVRAARSMLGVIERSNAQPRSFRIPDVHVGLAAGEVLVLPSDESVGWSLVGNAVNLASRLCDAAEPGQVLANEEVKTLVAGAETWSGVRQVDVRGAHDQVQVWALRAGPPTGEPSPPGVGFVNRVTDLARLDREWEAAATTGVGRLVTVVGETGIGKSRLVRHWATDRRVPTIWVWCGQASTSSHLGVLVEQVAHSRPDETGEALALWRAATERVASTVRTDPFPAALVAARRVLDSAATAGPLALVFDDAQLADTALHAFLHDVRSKPPRGSLLLLCTWRSDESEVPWPADVVLEPLSDTSTAELISTALGATPPPDLTNSLVARTAGHPLMTLQSAAYLVESGVVEVSGERCEVRSPEAVETLPTSLRLFVAARIDRLPTTEKAALQELSTFGERMSRNAVEALAARAVVEAIPSLVARGLLRDTEDGWRFSHGLMQQVTYASLPRTVRAELHRRLLQSFDRDRTGERVHHAVCWADCVSSTDVTQRRTAAHAALEAIHGHALRLSATQAAAAHAAVRSVTGLLEDFDLALPDEVAAVLTLDSQCLLEMGHFEAALHAADGALTTLRSTGRAAETRVEALLARGHALSRLRRFQAARQALDEAMALAEATGADVLRAQALRLIGDTWRYAAFGQFVALTEQAQEAFRAAGDSANATECACILAYLMSTSTSPRYRRWRDVAEAEVKEADVRGKAWLARTDLWAAVYRREATAARAAGAEAVRLGELTGSADCVADGLSALAIAGTALGDLDAALEAFQELRRLAVANANPRMRLYAASIGATVLLRRGDAAGSIDELSGALTQLDAFGLSEQYTVSMAAARVAADRGRWEEAARHTSTAIDSAAAANFTLPMLDARLLETRVYQQLGRPPADDYLASIENELGEVAPVVAGYARLLRAQLGRSDVDLPALAEPAAPEDVALRAETRALSSGASGGDARAEWATAADAWRVCGYTIWLARAQARCGDEAAAEETLRLVGADAAARAWAFGEARA